MWVDLILFADNYWFMATDHKMLVNMTVAWLSLLGNTARIRRCKSSRCAQRRRTTAPPRSTSKKRATGGTAQEGFKVLGTYVTFDNKFEVELDHMLTRADRLFWASWELLGCVSIPREKRIGVFVATVNATVVWCAGFGSLPREQNERLRTTQR